MKELSIIQMECIESGYNPDIVKACAIIGGAAGVFAIGAAANWWNPAGWVSGLVALAGTACDIYTINAGIETLTEKK